MTKVVGPIFSMSARGWLGKDTYARLGIVANPYPIALLPYRIRHHSYYRVQGWVYQLKRTWHGIIYSCYPGYWPTNPRTPAQQANREKWARAVEGWQGLGEEAKDVWRELAEKRPLSGFNLYMAEEMK